MRLKRFGDMLNLLSGILLTSIVMDFDELHNNFATLFLSQGNYFAVGIVSRLATINIICLFIRNIHGSIRYDELVEKAKDRAVLDSTHSGRFFAFCFALGTLFFGPSIIDQYLGHHALVRAGNGNGGELAHEMMTGQVFATVLLLPFVIYIVWDLLLWMLGTMEPGDGSEMDVVAYRWMVMDAVALILMQVFGLASLYRQWKNLPFNYEYATLGFMVISSSIVIGDYILNRRFYFPDEQVAERTCPFAAPSSHSVNSRN